MTPVAPLYGLVLAGGRSTRMGQDKGLIQYRGQPHREYLREVLRAHCARAFVSLNSDQAALAVPGLPLIIDDPRYETSPMGALLSAHAGHPGVGWWVLSCDLAYFDPGCALALANARDPARAGTAYAIHELGQPEPLATIYEQAFVATLPALYAAGERSLRRALHKSPAGCLLLESFDPRCVESVDTPEARAEAERRMR